VSGIGPGLFGAIVEGKALLQTVVAAFVGGVGVTFAFSVAIWGFGRSVELSAAGRRVAAGSAAAACGLALLAVLAAIAFGIAVMAHK
jgi:hypothetical protein